MSPALDPTAAGGQELEDRTRAVGSAARAEEGRSELYIGCSWRGRSPQHSQQQFSSRGTVRGQAVNKMASSMMISSTATAVINRAAPAPANSVAPFNGLKSTAAFPGTKKPANDLSAVPSNGGRAQCMKVWNPYNNIKFETLSYLPPLTDEQLAKEVDYLLRMKWIPCLEFDKIGSVYREHGSLPGYYDGRYWVMWKLPMFGCNDSAQVLRELAECKKEYPNCFIRIIGFDNVRQVQCISFIAYKPPHHK